ncbi:MAG: nickel-dependent lactate racemase [Thermoplasmatota archaeon]
MKVELPYGDSHLTADIPDSNLVEVIYPHHLEPEETASQYVQQALQAPLGCPPLSRLARRGQRVAIVVDDHTRPCPTWEMMPPVMEELHRRGIGDQDVTVIFSTGTHRPVKHEEARRLLGGDFADRLTYLSNECRGDRFTSVGTTSRGTEVKVNDVYLEADLRILLGDVEIHYFAGYGGGRKSVLPGICHYSTIQDNYTTNFFHPHARPGRLDGNPMYENMTEAARLAPPHFCLNVVQNARHQMVGAFAGDFDMVLRKGATVVDKMFKVQVKDRADIVVTAADGTPHDINLYQAYKAIHLALNVVNPGGIIILAAECPDGHGSQPYHDWMQRYATADEIQEELSREFVPGGHKAYFHARALEQAQFFMVSGMDRDLLEGVFHMRVFDSVDRAVQEALRIKGRDASLLAIPQGTTTLPV